MSLEKFLDEETSKEFEDGDDVICMLLQQKYPYHYQQNIIEQAYKLQSGTNAVLEGFIAGTNAKEIQGIEGNLKGLSMMLFDTVHGAFQELSSKIGMTFSVIAKRTNQSLGLDIITDGATNTRYVSPQRCAVKDDCIYDLPELRDNFGLIEISPNNRLFIHGEDVTDKL